MVGLASPSFAASPTKYSLEHLTESNTTQPTNQLVSRESQQRNRSRTYFFFSATGVGVEELERAEWADVGAATEDLDVTGCEEETRVCLHDEQSFDRYDRCVGHTAGEGEEVSRARMSSRSSKSEADGFCLGLAAEGFAVLHAQSE